MAGISAERRPFSTHLMRLRMRDDLVMQPELWERTGLRLTAIIEPGNQAQSFSSASLPSVLAMRTSAMPG